MPAQDARESAPANFGLTPLAMACGRPKVAAQFRQWTAKEVFPTIYRDVVRLVNAPCVLDDKEAMQLHARSMAERLVQEAEKGEVSEDDPTVKRARQLIAVQDEVTRREDESELLLVQTMQL